MKPLLCSECFKDEGLRLDAQRIGSEYSEICRNCGSKSGMKLDKDSITRLADLFFVRGTLSKSKYGAAPLVQFNQHQQTDLNLTPALKQDCKSISEAIGVGFFYYGPRLWMIGCITPLEDLLRAKKRNAIIERIINEYPTKVLNSNECIYRLRKNPSKPHQNDEYDSPPSKLSGNCCRFGSNELPILYASKDLEVCIHECRTTVEDELYIATILPKRNLKLLDLTELLEEDTTEFESLDISIHMLFSAGKHSYKISRAIALAVKKAGFDGMIYPSYFSDFRTGSRAFDTIHGISIRRIPDSNLRNHIKSQTIPNIALFGRPIAENIVDVKCINKLVLSRISYGFHFGPAIL